jgi:hypothetical protein
VRAATEPQVEVSAIKDRVVATLVGVLLVLFFLVCFFGPHVALQLGGPWLGMVASAAAFAAWLYLGPPPTCLGGGSLGTSLLGMLVLFHALGMFAVTLVIGILTYFGDAIWNRLSHY